MGTTATSAARANDTPQQIARYHNRLSGPPRDHLDLVVDVEAARISELTRRTPGESVE